MKREARKEVRFYAKGSEVRSATLGDGPTFLLPYKVAYLNTNELNSSFPSIVVSLLLEFEDVSIEDGPGGFVM